MSDLRLALRSLLRNPGFTVVVALTLALGIGATTAVFAVVRSVVLNPLPYHESDRLVALEHGISRINVPSGIGMTVGLYRQYALRSRALESLALYSTAEATVVDDGGPEHLQAVRTTESLPSVLGVAPELGRWFTTEEADAGPRVVVLSHRLWIQRYSGDPAILGETVDLDGETAEVIGVMPASFAFPDARAQLWYPDRIAAITGFGLPFGRIGVARMRPGTTIATTRAELNGLIDDLPNVYPGDAGVLGNIGQGGLRSTVAPLKEVMLGDVGRTLWILLIAVAIVLAVACANVANLFLARAEGRQRDVAVRRALGARLSRLVRLFVTESVLVSLAGGLLGLVVAYGAVNTLVSLGPATLPRLHEVRVDLVTAAVAMLITVVFALIFGSLPLAGGAPGRYSLRESTQPHTPSVSRLRTRHALMAAQVALALVLLMASGLLVRSFLGLRAVDPGFDSSSALTLRIALPTGAYPTRRSAVTGHHAILDRLAALPGVTAVSASTGLPLAERCFGNTVIVRGRATDGASSRPVAQLCAVAGGYVEAMGLRLLRGRGITRDDVERDEPNVVVSQAFASRVFPNEDPLGARIRSNAPPTSTPRPDGAGGFTWDGAPPWLTIVGIVADTPFRALAEVSPVPVVYMPMSIAGGPDIPTIAMLGPGVSTMTYIVRSSTPPLRLAPSVRNAIDDVDRTLATTDVETLEQILDRGSAQTAFTMLLLTIATCVTIALGLVGIYGVVSYVVAQRTREIGLRMALGAEPGSIARLILGGAGTVVNVGIALGIALSLSGGRAMESLLYGVSPRDPSTLVAATLTVLVTALLACWLPARRAARLSPLEALRTE